MTWLVEEDVCERFGLDPVQVGRLARRLKAVAKDCDDLGLIIFAGCFGGIVLRPSVSIGGTICATENLTLSLGDNCDGGDGGD